jgi:segregation and condensation protein B
MDFELLKRIIEAALLAAPQPLTVAQLADLFGEGEAPPSDDIRRALHTLQEDCATRGVELIEVASGFRYQVRSDVYPHIARLWAEKPPRYSRALLETLALIAYRQPITRGEIESIRGVAVNTQIIRTLEEREWIRVVGHRDVPGKPALFGTTRAFLDYFNLKSLDQLPTLAALQDLPELEPQLDFDGARVAKSALAPSIDAEATVETDAASTPESESESEDAAERTPADHAELDAEADPAAGDDGRTESTDVSTAPDVAEAGSPAGAAVDSAPPDPTPAAANDQPVPTSAALTEVARSAADLHTDDTPDTAGTEATPGRTDDNAAAAADSHTGEPETSPEQIP